MKGAELYIYTTQWEKLDLYGNEVIQLTKQIANIDEESFRQSNFSLDFDTPLTKRNQRVFGYVDNVNSRQLYTGYDTNFITFDTASFWDFNTTVVGNTYKWTCDTKQFVLNQEVKITWLPNELSYYIGTITSVDPINRNIYIKITYKSTSTSVFAPGVQPDWQINIIYLNTLKYPAIVMNNGYLVSKGFIEINTITKRVQDTSVNVTFFGEQLDFFLKMDGGLRDLDVSDTNDVAWDAITITTSNNFYQFSLEDPIGEVNSPVYWGFVDYADHIDITDIDVNNTTTGVVKYNRGVIKTENLTVSDAVVIGTNVIGNFYGNRGLYVGHDLLPYFKTNYLVNKCVQYGGYTLNVADSTFFTDLPYSASILIHNDVNEHNGSFPWLMKSNNDEVTVSEDTLTFTANPATSTRISIGTNLSTTLGLNGYQGGSITPLFLEIFNSNSSVILNDTIEFTIKERDQIVIRRVRDGITVATFNPTTISNPTTGEYDILTPNATINNSYELFDGTITIPANSILEENEEFVVEFVSNSILGAGDYTGAAYNSNNAYSGFHVRNYGSYQPVINVESGEYAQDINNLLLGATPETPNRFVDNDKDSRNTGTVLSTSVNSVAPNSFDYTDGRVNYELGRIKAPFLQNEVKFYIYLKVSYNALVTITPSSVATFTSRKYVKTGDFQIRLSEESPKFNYKKVLPKDLTIGQYLSNIIKTYNLLFDVDNQTGVVTMDRFQDFYAAGNAIDLSNNLDLSTPIEIERDPKIKWLNKTFVESNDYQNTRYVDYYKENPLKSGADLIYGASERLFSQKNNINKVIENEFMPIMYYSNLSLCTVDRTDKTFRSYDRFITTPLTGYFDSEGSTIDGTFRLIKKTDKNLTSIAFPNVLETARFNPNGQLILIDEYPSNSGIGIFFSFFGNTLAAVQDTTKYDYLILTPEVDAETDTFNGAQFYSVGHIFNIMNTSLLGLDNISLTYRYDEALYQQDMGIVSELITGLPGTPTLFKRPINGVWYWTGINYKYTGFANEPYPLLFSRENVIDLTEAYFSEFEDDLDPSINVYNKVKCRVFLTSKQLAEIKLNDRILLNFGKGEGAYYRISKLSSNLDGNNPTTLELVRLNKY